MNFAYPLVLGMAVTVVSETEVVWILEIGATPVLRQKYSFVKACCL